MNRFGTVFEHEFRQTIKSKAFKTISVIFIIVLAALCVGVALLAFEESKAEEPQANSVVSDMSDPSQSKLAVVDMTEDGAGERLANLIGAKVIEAADEKTYIDFIENEKYKSVIVLSRSDGGSFDAEIFEKSSLYGESAAFASEESLLLLRRLEMLGEHGIDETQAALLLSANDVEVNVRSVGELAVAKYIISFVVMIMMFICITLYGQLVAVNVATEKSTRTMELLLTSASSRSLLMGKVLGTGAAVMLQIILFFCTASAVVTVGAGASPAIAAVLDTVMTLSAADAVCFAAFFALGFLLIAFIFGALGSLVNQIEDLSALISLPNTVFMIGYFIAVMVSSSGSAGTFGKVCSFIPFWSPMVMTVRMAVEEVPFAEILVSLLLQGAACAAAALLSAKIYRMGTLMYGKAPKISEVGKMLRYK